MDSQAAIDYAAEHFPNQPIHDFGRLIRFRYHNNPSVWRWVIIEEVYADYVDGYCLLRHAEYNNQAQARRKFWFDHIVSDIGLIDGQDLTCRQYYESFVKKYYPERHFGYQMIDGLRINEGKPQVYFTGFPAAEKKALESIANDNGFWFFGTGQWLS